MASHLLAGALVKVATLLAGASVKVVTARNWSIDVASPSWQPGLEKGAVAGDCAQVVC